jgi:hypothetical protein
MQSDARYAGLRRVPEVPTRSRNLARSRWSGGRLHHLVAATLAAHSAPARVGSGGLSGRLRRGAGRGRPRPGRTALEEGHGEPQNDDQPPHCTHPHARQISIEKTPGWRHGFQRSPAVHYRRTRWAHEELPSGMFGSIPSDARYPFAAPSGRSSSSGNTDVTRDVPGCLGPDGGAGRDAPFTSLRRSAR